MRYLEKINFRMLEKFLRLRPWRLMGMCMVIVEGSLKGDWA